MKAIDFTVSEHNSASIVFLLWLSKKAERDLTMSKLEWVKKIVIIVFGSIVAAYGITLALYAGFGGATLAVLLQVI